MTDAGGREASRPVVLGERFGVHISGARVCVGVRRHVAGGSVRGCPFQARLPATGAGAQCDACAAADPGRMLARDATVDPRPFRLYLACFGKGPLKVGISAAERGSERLLEQGALAFTWLAEGTHPTIRATEAAVSGAGIAVERRRRDSKPAGWWHPGTAAERRDTLLTAAQKAHSLGTWPTGAQPVLPTVVDQLGLFGLGPAAGPAAGTGPLPRQLDDIDQLREGAHVVGRVRAVAGTEVLLDHADQTLVLGGRTLAGWPISPTTSAVSGGYSIKPIRDIAGPAEPALF